MHGTHRARVFRYRESECFPADDVVVREEPLEVRLNGSTLVYLMRLPGDEVPLVAGFCLSEGLIREPGDLQLIRHCVEPPGNLVEVQARLSSDAGRFGGRVIRTGCGGSDMDREAGVEGIRVESRVLFPASTLIGFPEKMLSLQEVFRATGGTHGAGVFNISGEPVVVKEDVGRHNAVDKALGHLLLTGEPASDKCLLLSGRLSYEMVLKAARSGVPLICSISAPTALGVDLAEKTGVTMVGFLRDRGFNVYSHPERIGGA